jgi:predicted regulator of Ras-like GTPase activity (Roadblock/LC7/MglB family)
MGVEEALQEVNAIPGVEGGILFTEEGTILAHTLPERYAPEALASAVRIAARTMEALETSRRRIQEVDLVFAAGRLILRRLPGGFLALCCARSVNLPLLLIFAFSK